MKTPQILLRSAGRKFDFQGVSLASTVFSCANLSGADLSRVNLSHSQLNNADLSGTVLVSIKLN
ncbi:pentapeptide repeat-containing protein [Lyngbya aestuarii]|uniref:pentapeptide repeat-containing protein n=1 Tax=Lyngbya aestuarii TaxID=118322 RepID=UPI00403D9CFE